MTAPTTPVVSSCGRARLTRRSLLGVALAGLAACAQTGGGEGGDGAGSSRSGRGGLFGGLFSSGNLPGSQWRFVEVLGKPVPATEKADANVLAFDKDDGGRGTFSASIGCNRMNGRYRLRDDEVQFRIEQSTRMACEGDTGLAERRMVAALGSTSNYRIERDRLELVAQGQVLATLLRR